jgi:hypothetical protein
MDFAAAIALPTLLLIVVVAGYWWTVFEPYFAINSDEGRELMQYHAADPKLLQTARWWAATLTDPAQSMFDDESTMAGRLRQALLFELARHRFLTGDDPSRLCCGPVCSRLLRRAKARAGLGCADPKSQLLLLVTPRLVKVSDGTVVWRGLPQRYRSRFKDKYDGDDCLFSA